MASHLFKYIPFTVSQLTTAIESGALALPDIQRPFVWPQTKVRDLLDKELPLEADLTRWFAVWGAPGL